MLSIHAPIKWASSVKWQTLPGWLPKSYDKLSEEVLDAMKKEPNIFATPASGFRFKSWAQVSKVTYGPEISDDKQFST